jgi:hypothetical protein
MAGRAKIAPEFFHFQGRVCGLFFCLFRESGFIWQALKKGHQAWAYEITIKIEREILRISLF